MKDTITVDKKWLYDVVLKQVQENTSILATHSSLLKSLDNDLMVLKRNQIINPQMTKRIHVTYER